jgi:hypothetical protein
VIVGFVACLWLEMAWYFAGEGLFFILIYMI